MSSLENLTVLVVDDNRHMVGVVKSVLNGLGVGTVLTALGAEDAVDMLQGSSCNVVICDCNMQGGGIEFVTAIRSDENNPNRVLPIIMLTAYSDQSRVREARDAGVSEFVAKPVSPEILEHRLMEVIERPRPIVRSKQYFGPDRRRRRQSGEYEGPNRRKDAHAGAQSDPEAAAIGA